MTDQFTCARVTKLLSDWKHKHGRDISKAELLQHGISEDTIDGLVREEILVKYQVTAKGGRTENRFKIFKDWRSLSL